MEQLKQKLVRLTEELGMDLCGVADATEANAKAPPGFTPEDQLSGARAVLIFAQRLPSGSFFTRDGAIAERYYMRSWWSNVKFMDQAAYRLVRLLEEEAGYPSVPIPANEPLRVHNGTPRGMVSLKHMGQLAGIGAIATNSLLVHPEHGNLLRLGGLITRAPLPPDAATKQDPCPDDCGDCVSACPVDAIRDRSVDIIRCMQLSLRHPLMQPYTLTRYLFQQSTRSEKIRRLLEDLSNMLITQYSESCTRCLVACRHFQTALERAQQKSCG